MFVIFEALKLPKLLDLYNLTFRNDLYEAMVVNSVEAIDYQLTQGANPNILYPSLTSLNYKINSEFKEFFAESEIEIDISQAAQDTFLTSLSQGVLSPVSHS